MEDEDQDYIKEAQIGENPDSLTPEQMEKSLFQMKNCVCKIKLNNGIIGTGFFCKIPFPDNFTFLPVLITCNHVLNNNNISQGKKIDFSLNNEQFLYSILITSSRKIYTNEKNDVTIIEIKPEEDNIEFKSFLDVDENIYKDNPNEVYRNKTIYIIHYEKGKEVKYSLGTIKNIGTNNYTIRHFCTTQEGSSGSPILNLLNSRVLGVHKGTKDFQINLGTLIKTPINEFNVLYNKKKLKNCAPNNIIYYNETIDLNSFDQNIKTFENKTNGAFILCTNMESLKIIVEEIINENQKDKRIIFNLIINGNDCEKIMNFINLNKNFRDCIKNSCIYCMNSSEYYYLKEKYKIIYDIYDSQQNVINFIIETSLKEIKPFPLEKIITYEDFLVNFRDLYFKVGKYYEDLSPESYEVNIKKIKLFIQEEIQDESDQNRVLNGFLLFDVKKNSQYSDMLIIGEYIDNLYC